MFGRKAILFLILTLMTGIGSMSLCNTAQAYVFANVTLNSSSPSGPTPIGAYTSVLKFDIHATADALTLNAVTFRFYADDNEESDWFANGSGNPITIASQGWRLRDLGSRMAYIPGNWQLYAVDGDTPSNGENVRYARVVFNNPVTVSNGSTRHFLLMITTTGAGDNDRFRAVVHEEDGAPYGSTLYNLDEFDFSGIGEVSGLPLYGNILVLQD
jgi:hypothetical protein